MNIDFIKWMVGYAEGFELSLMSVGNYDPDPKYSVDIADLMSIGFGAIKGDGCEHSFAMWQKVYYPLLLQRAIEGCIGYACRIDDDYITIIKYEGERELFPIGESIDEAKEQALKYIYEQELQK